MSLLPSSPKIITSAPQLPENKWPFSPDPQNPGDPFGTMVAYGVQIIKDYSDYRYGLGAQGQGQIYLNLSYSS